ncbi:MAG: AMP-binding protein, partial [Rhodospirillaceae bacterium]|nr:AMP-binding protein [Rhodospirillaceae bacterium]
IGRLVGGNEEVVAFVQPLESKRVTEDDLRDFIADKLAPYKRPSLYQFRDELPAAAGGKILKHRLGQELE